MNLKPIYTLMFSISVSVSSLSFYLLWPSIVFWIMSCVNCHKFLKHWLTSQEGKHMKRQNDTYMCFTHTHMQACTCMIFQKSHTEKYKRFPSWVKWLQGLVWLPEITWLLYSSGDWGVREELYFWTSKESYCTGVRERQYACGGHEGEAICLWRPWY